MLRHVCKRLSGENLHVKKPLVRPTFRGAADDCGVEAMTLGRLVVGRQKKHSRLDGIRRSDGQSHPIKGTLRHPPFTNPPAPLNAPLELFSRDPTLGIPAILWS